MTTIAVIPDSHGSLIDKPAARAFLKDLKALDPEMVVMLGDHVDCSGLFSSHGRNHPDDVEYSYVEDLDAANDFLDDIQKAAPRAKIHYIEGNHEGRCARFASENIANSRDLAMFVADNAPAAKLKLKDRGIKFYSQTEFYHGLSIPNTIKLGRCYFTHGCTAGKHATASHVDRFGANIVHGHTHRAQSFHTRNIQAGVYAGWCPGTLSKLQPTYMHTNPSSWVHGYGLLFCAPSGRFQYINVAINHGVSLLSPLLARLS